MNSLGLSLREISELAQSTFIVGVVFTIASHPDTDPLSIALIFAVAVVCAGAGFFLHELMHKVAAQRLGYFAEYHASQFSFVSILFAFAGWILLSPGAVYISGLGRPISRRANGIISLAGPATNLLLALGFYLLSLSSVPIIGTVSSFGFNINIWLAIFNTLPAPTFDGNKILGWNKAVYACFGLILAVVFFLF
jgi:Zn-dependent protease